MRLKCLAPIVAVGLLLVACSDDDDASSASTVAVTSTVAPATTEEATATTEASATTETPTTTTELVPLPTSFAAPTGPPCEVPEGSGMLVTPDCVDPALATAPFVDVDEVRTTTDENTGVTVSYRYVHGGFTDTNTRFSFYFPAPEDYQGRFFESTYPTVSEEDAADDTIAFAISNGAYVVSSNNSGGVAADPTVGGYRANAAAAKFSRVIAAELYGEDAATRGYIYGASGGAYQTIGAAENTEGVWDGAVPMVPGVPNAIPSFQGVQVLALRVLQDKWPEIADALEPGGSGDPYATLSDDERAVLEEATKLGHPLRGWWQWETLKGGSFGITVLAVQGIDAGYVNDFWSLPGYEGFDDPAVQAARVQFDTTIAEVGDDPVTSVTLTDTPTGFLTFTDLVITSGAAAGETINGASVDGAVVTFPGDVDPEVAAAIAAGDQVRIDNSLWIALEYYQRHQVPGPEFGEYGWDQYRDAAGTPLYAQRPTLVGHIISQVFGGVATGNFNGKMIMLSSVLDVQAFPWSAEWYQTHAQAALGDELEDNYRLWYMDNADHQPPSTTEGYSHIVLYDSELQQALLDLDAWVAEDVSPPASSNFEITEDNQVLLAPTAQERNGVQPVVDLTVTAGDDCDDSSDDVRVDVAAGDPVSFNATAQVPAGAGEIVRVEWDWESSGEFPDTTDLDETSADLQICETHTYDEPGTYFAVVRVTSQREGDTESDYRLIQNLARVRIVVA